MDRRTLLTSFLSVLAAVPLGGVRLFAQAALLDAAHGHRVRDLAAVVLPSSLGRQGTDAAADGFLAWVRDYRAGVLMDHGYGATRVQRTPPLPVERYIQQLADLDARAGDAGAASFGDAPAAVQRTLVESALRASAITTMPQRPAGQHIAADLMTFYFRSSEANDRCYGARVERYACRGLDDAGKPPAPLAPSR